VAEAAAVWQKLDDLEQDLDQIPKQAKVALTPGSVTGMSTLVLSVGYVIWVLRGGSLVVTLLTTMPLWRWLDPLPVLDNFERRKGSGKGGGRDEDQDEENIRRMME